MPRGRTSPRGKKKSSRGFLEYVKRGPRKIAGMASFIINFIKSHKFATYVVASLIIAALTCSPSHYLVCVPLMTSFLASIYLIFSYSPRAFGLSPRSGEVAEVINYLIIFIIIFLESVLLTVAISNDGSLMLYFSDVVLRAAGVLLITLGIAGSAAIVYALPVIVRKLRASIRSLRDSFQLAAIYPEYGGVAKEEYLKFAALLLLALFSTIVLIILGAGEYLALSLILHPSAQSQSFFIALSLSATIMSYLLGITSFLEKQGVRRGAERLESATRRVVLQFFSEAQLIPRLFIQLPRLFHQIIKQKRVETDIRQLKQGFYEWVLGLSEPDPKALFRDTFLIPYIILTGLRRLLALFSSLGPLSSAIQVSFNIISLIIVGPPLGALSVIALDDILSYLKLSADLELEGDKPLARLFALLFRSLLVEWAVLVALMAYPLVVYKGSLTYLISFQLIGFSAVYVWLERKNVNKVVKELAGAAIIVTSFICFLALYPFPT